MYPLNQKSVPVSEADKALIAKSRPVELNDGVDYAGARSDYLPPEYITFLMTGWPFVFHITIRFGYDGSFCCVGRIV